MNASKPKRLLICAALLLTSACGPRESSEQRHADANTPAGKAGQAAHKLATEAGKAGRVIGRKLEKAAHDAHEGWNEQAKKENQKK